MVMLTAIAAMFEMASSLTRQQMMTAPADDGYSLSSWRVDDQRFLRLISSPDAPSWGSGPALCAKILEEIKPGKEFGTLSGYSPGPSGESSHSVLVGSCVFQKSEHRVLINRRATAAGSSAYGFLSCNPRPQDGVGCSFERSRF